MAELPSCIITAEYVQWQPFAILTFSLVALGLSVIYMGGRLLRKPEWEAFVREELYQLFLALIFVLGISAAVSTTCAITWLAANETNPFSTALSHLADLRKSIDEHSEIALVYGDTLRFMSAEYSAYGDVTIGFYSGCASLAATQHTLVSILSAFIGSIIAQQYLLMFIPTFAMQFLLPLSIILRIVPLTRKSSAIIMALSFALYSIFPLTYLLGIKASEDVNKIYSDEMEDIDRSITKGDCESPLKLLRNIKTVGYIIPQTVFFPALSLIITIAATRAVSKVFEYEFR